MNDEHERDINEDSEGWWWTACSCGYLNGPFLGQEDALDDYLDHIS